MSAPLDRAAEQRRVVLLVQGEDEGRRALHLFLTGRGYDVRAYPAPATLLGDAMIDQAGLLVTDYRLPESDGIGLLAKMRQRGWCGRAVLMAGQVSAQLQDAARTAGFAAVMNKPLQHQHLLLALEGRTR